MIELSVIHTLVEELERISYVGSKYNIKTKDLENSFDSVIEYYIILENILNKQLLKNNKKKNKRKKN